METTQGRAVEKQLPVAMANAARAIGNKAADMASEQLSNLAAATEVQVKKNPLPAIGIALGVGAGLGVLGTMLFTPKKVTLLDRVADMQLGSQVGKLIKRFF